MKRLLAALLVSFTCATASAQSVGLAFSYFVPRNGSFSTPISPFSIRGIGVDLTRSLAVETGASLYRMSGLSMTGLPFNSQSSLTGPNFTIFIPANLVFAIHGKGMEIDFKAGGFFFYSFDQQLQYGNLDREIRAYKGWDVANSQFSFENHPGFGYLAGVEFNFDVTSQWGLSLECNYLAGQSSIPLTGSYSGGTLGGPSATVQDSFPDAKVDFTGLEFSIGIMFKTGKQGKPAGRKRR